MQIKWDTLKHRAKKGLAINQSLLDARAVASICPTPDMPNSGKLQGPPKEFREETIKCIDRWDVH